jgi:hypothetical protein
VSAVIELSVLPHPISSAPALETFIVPTISLMWLHISIFRAGAAQPL